MKQAGQPTDSGLHLVQPSEQPKEAQTPTPSQQELDSLIAEGIRTYQKLQEEFDRELFAGRDLEKIATLLPQLQMLRARLEAYGVRVRV